jgi:hypothetical protein
LVTALNYDRPQNGGDDRGWPEVRVY